MQMVGLDQTVDSTSAAAAALDKATHKTAARHVDRRVMDRRVQMTDVGLPGPVEHTACHPDLRHPSMTPQSMANDTTVIAETVTATGTAIGTATETGIATGTGMVHQEAAAAVVVVVAVVDETQIRTHTSQSIHETVVAAETLATMTGGGMTTGTIQHAMGVARIGTTTVHGKAAAGHLYGTGTGIGTETCTADRILSDVLVSMIWHDASWCLVVLRDIERKQGYISARAWWFHCCL